MNCDTAKERILQVDPAELVPGVDSALGRHLLECADCRAAAATVLDGMTLLDRGLDAADEPTARDRRGKVRSVRRWAPAVAAAAVVVGLMITRPWEPSFPAGHTPIALAEDSSRPVVEDPEGAAIAVFATKDPSITVVWIYEEDRP